MIWGPVELDKLANAIVVMNVWGVEESQCLTRQAVSRSICDFGKWDDRIEATYLIGPSS